MSHPSRPERSQRRPLNTPSPSPSTNSGRFPDQHSYASASGAPTVNVAPSGRQGSNGAYGEGSPLMDNGGNKSRRMMDNLVNGSNGRDSPTNSPRMGSSLKPSSVPPSLPPRSQPSSSSHQRNQSGSSTTSSHSSNSRSPSPAPAAPPPTAALNTAISAFSSAGQRRDGRTRRGGVADQGYNQPAAPKGPKSKVLDPTEYPDTPAFREIDTVLRKVDKEWKVLLNGIRSKEGAEEEDQEDFDPVTLALSLLDPSTVGTPHSLPAFLRLKAELDHAISSTLSSSSSSYRAYESSITTYNTILASLGNNQRMVNGLKKNLGHVRERLEGGGREGLAGMWNRVAHLEEMGGILDEIDHLRSIPDRLETLMSDKRFLSAVILLSRSLKSINKPEMMEIGALTDLRTWLVGQEGVLLEILIEELHNHLYLKSFYCDARWKAYTRGQTSLPLVDFGDDVEVSSGPSHLEATFHTAGRSTAKLPRMSKLQRYLTNLSLAPSHNPMLDEPIDDVRGETVDDSTGLGGYDGFGSFVQGMEDVDLSSSGMGGKKERKVNAELDSFVYIESLMESLAVLGKLGYALDSVGQRVQIEVFNLVEATVEEVDERIDSTRAALSDRPQSIVAANSTIGSLATLSTLSLSRPSAHRSSLLRLTASESSNLEMNVETLKDLFWTLFSKLDAVLQGFRVAYEVAMRISERRDFKDSSIVKASSGSLLFSLIEVWRPVQQEVRALLHDYLADDQTGTVSSRNPIVSVNEVLRLARPRDWTKQMFKFADSDIKASSKALKVHEDELNRALKVAVPGLMMEGAAGGGQLVANAMVTDDRRSGPGGTHKALVQADAFNVSVLFGPTWAFLERVKEVMPGGLLGDDDAGGFGGFLDEFVLKTFLPQLEEKVTTVFHQAVGGHEAFQEDPNYRKLSPVPIVKSVTNLMLLINSLCSMLRATPFHRESYSHLIVSVIHQFYQKCHERFKDLAAREHMDGSPHASSLKTSAVWADMSEVNYCMVELRNTPTDDAPAMREALRRETKIELDKKGNGPINSDDLITPSKKILALGTLYSSLDWFIKQVSALKTSSSAEGNPGQMEHGSFAFDDGGSPMQGGMSSETNSSLTLPLTKEMAQPFDALLQSYRSLANLVLFTLRLEIRIRTMHYLDKATRDGVYQLAEDIAEPDPSVVDLNSDLAECDECAASTLAGPERRFIFEGLSLLMDQLLVSNSRHIRLANNFGLSKMMRNILALQQNLKNIGDTPLEVDFDRSRKYWEVFGWGPKGMLEAIRSHTISYDFEDYKALLNLMCGIDQSAKDSDTAATTGAGTDAAPLLSAGGDKSRRLYNEYLIDLFAAVDGDGFEEGQI